MSDNTNTVSELADLKDLTAAAPAASPAVADPG